jgi:membrane protein implicated in regulation of membrane protease activity
MDDPELWRWIWLVAVGIFSAGEAILAGSFFLLPFAAGAVVATIVAFSGAGIAAQWLSFTLVSAFGAFLLIPLRRRLDRAKQQNGVGARRLIDQEAVVTSAIGAGPGQVGEVLLGRETWRAQSIDQSELSQGTAVRVVEVRGTAVIVTAQSAQEHNHVHI